MKELSKMKEGDRGVIVAIRESEITQVLHEMCVLPGEKVHVSRIAPLGDPISVRINGSMLSLRKEEASAILVEEADRT